jgi:hypothetical protein
MKVASATATRVHHRLAIALLRFCAVQDIYTVYLYVVPICCSYTLYIEQDGLYVV